MNFLNYSLTALISYLGLVVGLIVMKSSKEEQKAGKKYFILIKKIILLLIIASLLYFLKLSVIIFLIILSIIFILFKKYKNKKLVESYYLYGIFGIVFYLSLVNLKLLLIESSLIFVYGLVSASLLINFKRKNYLEIILKHSSFLITALLLFSFSIMF